MQPGQIPYIETEKSSTVSVNAMDGTECIYRGHYMPARRHESSLRVLKICHERAQRTSNFAEMFLSSYLLGQGQDLLCNHGNAELFRA